MPKKSQLVKEHVIREYPNTTFWLEGQKVLGMGNLILTSERLIFLNRVALEDWQINETRKLLNGDNFDRLVQYALKLHKKNFEIPLLAVVSVRMGLYSFLPFPRICMRLRHLTARDNRMETTFLFRIPFIKGFVQSELTLVMGWVNAVKRAAKNKKRQK